jgi:hypothetical protein
MQIDAGDSSIRIRCLETEYRHSERVEESRSTTAVPVGAEEILRCALRSARGHAQHDDGPEERVSDGQNGTSRHVTFRSSVEGTTLSTEHLGCPSARLNCSATGKPKKKKGLRPSVTDGPGCVSPNLGGSAVPPFGGAPSEEGPPPTGVRWRASLTRHSQSERHAPRQRANSAWL